MPMRLLLAAGLSVAVPAQTVHVVQGGGAALQNADPSSFVFTLLGLPEPVLSLPWGEAWLSPMSAFVDLAPMPASGSRVYSSSLIGVPSRSACRCASSGTELRWSREQWGEGLAGQVRPKRSPRQLLQMRARRIPNEVP